MKDEFLLRTRNKREQSNETVEEVQQQQPNLITDKKENDPIEREPACPRLNPGVMPFSEYETHSFNALLKSMQTKPTLYLSMHTYSQLMIYPYGYTNKTSEFKDELDVLSRLAVDAIQSRHASSDWKAGGTIDVLYQAHGISIDWVHQEIRVPYVFLLEMRDQGDFGFLLPEDEIRPAADEVWSGVTAMLEHLLKNRTVNQNC